MEKINSTKLAIPLPGIWYKHQYTGDSKSNYILTNEK